MLLTMIHSMNISGAALVDPKKRDRNVEAALSLSLLKPLLTKEWG